MRIRLLFPIMISVAALAACGPSGGNHSQGNPMAQAPANNDSDKSGQSDGEASSSDTDKSDDEQQDNSDDSTEQAIEELGDQSYEDVRGSSECTDDCSGHNAGWEWAKENRILDPDDCSGDSDSFVEGCKAYTEELEERAGH